MHTLRLLALPCLLGLGLCTAQAANTSIYTPLEFGTCRNLETNPEGTGWVQDLCPGVAGYALLLSEGDLRQNVVVVPPKGKGSSLNLIGVVGSGFSSTGPRAEWRMAGKVPVALIVRYNVADFEDSNKNVSWLAVAKLGKTTCVVGKVAAGPNQNVQARALADRAAGMACLRPA